jgi:hypothetical protein
MALILDVHQKALLNSSNAYHYSNPIDREGTNSREPTDVEQQTEDFIRPSLVVKYDEPLNYIYGYARSKDEGRSKLH